MTPIDFRDATFADLQERLQGQREAVLRAWQKYGPGTTAAVCRAAGMSILTFRPRTTELHQLGFICLAEYGVALAGENPIDRGGFYRVRTHDELIAWLDAARAAAAERQTELDLRARCA